MHAFRRCRSFAALSLLIGGALTLPAYGAAQQTQPAWEDSVPASSIIPLAPAPAEPPLPPRVLAISAPATRPAVRRAFLSDTGRAGMYIGLALGAQIGAVQALTSCQRRREGHCLENHLLSEVAFTIGAGAIGAIIGTLIGRRPAAAAEPATVAAPPPVAQPIDEMIAAAAS